MEGDHFFRFEETAEGTMFTHGEQFKRLLGLRMRGWSSQEGTRGDMKGLDNVEGFNKDLNRRSEEGE